MKKRYMLSVISVIALVGLACSSGSSSDETSDASEAATTASEEKTPDQWRTAPIGDPIDNGDVVVTVDNLVFGVESGNSAFKAKNGVFATIDVSMEVTGDKYTVAATSWQLTAADGTTYSAEVLVPGIDDVLEFQTLSTGQKTSGKVVFDVDEAVFGDDSVTVSHTHTINDPITWTA